MPFMKFCDPEMCVPVSERRSPETPVGRTQGQFRWNTAMSQAYVREDLQ